MLLTCGRTPRTFGGGAFCFGNYTGNHHVISRRFLWSCCYRRQRTHLRLKVREIFTYERRISMHVLVSRKVQVKPSIAAAATLSQSLKCVNIDKVQWTCVFFFSVCFGKAYTDPRFIYRVFTRYIKLGSPGH